MVMVKRSSLRQKTARTVGAENICLDTVKQLAIRQFLTSHGFSEIQTDMAIMQIIARAIYPGSELRTVRCLQENSALCELLGISPENVNRTSSTVLPASYGMCTGRWKAIFTTVSATSSA